MKSTSIHRGGGGYTTLVLKCILLASFAILARLSFYFSCQILSHQQLLGDVIKIDQHPNNVAGDQTFMNEKNNNNQHDNDINNDDAPAQTRGEKNIVEHFNGTEDELDAPRINPEELVTVDSKKARQIRSNKLLKKTKSQPTKDDSGGIKLHQEYIDRVRGLAPFPKKLHILFPHKDYYKQHPDLPFVKHTILRFIENNPTWEVTIYDDADMDSIIAQAAADDIISVDEKHALLGHGDDSPAHPVERADLARMLIMWYSGGLYVDADALRNPRDFNKVFGPTVKMCLPIYIDVNFAQSLACSSPKNQLYMKMIREMSKYRMKSNKGNPIERRGGWAKRNDLFAMGPPMYNRIVYNMVFREINRGVGVIEGVVEHMKVLQERASDVIATGQFIDECNSFIAEPFEGCAEQSRAELYKLYNMSSWSAAVNARWA